MIQKFKDFPGLIAIELKYLTYPKKEKVLKDTVFVLMTACIIALLISLETAGVNLCFVKLLKSFW